MWGLLGVLAVALGLYVWSSRISSTRIAFVNYQVIELGQISKANDNGMIQLSEVAPENIDELEDYDMVLINGMGLHIDEQQRQRLKQIAENVPVLTRMATNPANRITSVDSVDAHFILKYLENGGRKNYRSMLNYVRKFVDGKTFKAEEPDLVDERPDFLITHIDPKRPDDDELGFNSVAGYHRFLKENNLFKEGAPQVIVTGFMGVGSDFVKALEDHGMIAYRVNKMQAFITRHHADSIRPAAVINMAHGRLGDYMVEYLKQKNIPLFCPLNVNRLVDDWEEDKMGMSGGFLSQSLVTPEIDGAVRPCVVFGHRINNEGLQEAYGIPNRLETYMETVARYVNLQHKPNAQKRIAIYYFKGPGQNALTASGMEVGPSLYNLLVKLKQEGYRVDGLPATSEGLERMIQQQGAVFGTYAEGAFDDFMRQGHPALVTAPQYADWTRRALSDRMRKELKEVNGDFPGKYMATADGRLGIARIQLGHVALLPHVMAGEGGNSFKIMHGTGMAPPHTYVASYLWARYAFKADALIHFGTHGSLEYTPRKQVALGSNDWPDRLVGALPHFYVYTIGNVGEGMIAKRRTYAQLLSYLTPPFMESELRSTYKKLSDAIDGYNKQPSDAKALKVKALTVEMGIHRELGLDGKNLQKPYTAGEIERLEAFAEELANEKITGQLYTMGVAYEPTRIETSVYAMATDPIAYGLLGIDKLKRRAAADTEKHKQLFALRYLAPAKETVGRLLASPSTATDEYICKLAGISMQELKMAREVEAMRTAPDPIMLMMQMAEKMGVEKSEPKAAQSKTVSELRASHVSGHGKVPQIPKAVYDRMAQSGSFPEKMMTVIRKEQKWYKGSPEEAADKKRAAASKDRHGKPAGTKKPGMDSMMGVRKQKYTRGQVRLAQAITAVEQAVKNVGRYRAALAESPQAELASVVNALNGGYTAPSPGGDPIVNPNTLPTGRNLYAVNAENTPTEDAWEKGVELADNTIAMYRRRHGGAYPRKVSYTLWSSEFIETEGATIAQVLYMLGVEPIRDAFGRVADVRLIPSGKLGRPRIDVVVQTSGQLRDLAASRLFLINKAVEMAAAAGNDAYENQVKAGVTESEKTLVEKGMSPKEAREVSRFRVFGGANGSYGTGIQGMVEAGDRWDKESQIAEVYLNNMGAFYGDEKNWETVRQAAFEAALTRTDVVIQPRQSNTWGALSLDHVYEFMGGLNLAVRNVTGKDPDAYLADYRNHNNMRMQEVKEAIGVESRTTIFNPSYIKEKMKGGAGSADGFSDIVTNTYGWNVMKPAAIDKELWDEIYNVYVKDKFDLGIKEFFSRQNPAALEEMTAVMMETVRKGLWKATARQQQDIARLHVEMVNRYKPSCSGFVCDNAKLRDFIASKADAASAKEYRENISGIREAKRNGGKGVVMKKDTVDGRMQQTKTMASGAIVGGIVIIAFVLLILIVRHRRKNIGG